MIEDFLNSLSIPETCRVSKKIDKKEFIENFSLNVNDRKILSQYINKITLEYLLNQDNINILPFTDEIKDYSEIAIIKVQISNQDKLKSINNIIQQIPYPLIVFYIYENQISLSLCVKRINKADSSKLVVDEVNFSEWIDLNSINEIDKKFLENLNINNHPFTDFLSFYESIINVLISFEASKYTGTINFSKGTKKLLSEIQSIEINITELKNRIKKETNFNEKVNMNIELKKLNDIFKFLKKSI
jgi:hypothetical protein